jgi:pseudouridine synthase
MPKAKSNFDDTNESAAEGVRLQKVLASAGVASRRVCEQFIVAGKVRVNGKVVKELGTRINPEVDQVSVNGQPIQLDSSRVYLALNKPYGVVSSMQDENGRPDLMQFVVDYDRVFNVGRLDAETTGLIIMTNDGDLAHKLAHPKFGVKKTYLAHVEGKIENSTIQKLLDGIELEDGFIAADECRLKDVAVAESLVEIVLHSGRNRIVRRMLAEVGHPVIGLVRQQFGPIRLGHLKPGQVRDLNKLEVGSLLKAAEGGSEKKPRPARSGGKTGSKTSKRR